MKLKTLVMALGLTSSALMLAACGDKGQTASSSESSATATEQSAPAAQNTAQQAASEASSAAQEESKSMVEQVQEKAQAAADTVTEKAQQASEAAQNVASAVAEKASQAAEAASSAASGAMQAVAQAAGGGSKVDGADVYGQCVGCHGPQGGGGVGPKLAGQSKDDLVKKLKAYKAGEQVGPQTAMMAPMAQGLSDDEIEAVAEYISSTFK